MKYVCGLAVAAAIVIVCMPLAMADTRVNRVLKDDGPGLPIVPVAGPGEVAWQGLYLGASIGGGWGTSTQNYDRAGDHGAASLDPAGGLVALNAGYNWRFSDNWVAGVEGDFGLMNVSQGATTVFDGHVWSTDYGPFWGTARARAGYLVTDDLLAYATGGLAMASIDDTSIGNTPGETATESGMRMGFVIGAGAEYALDERWSLKAEYLYMDFGEVSGQSTNSEDYSFSNDVHVLRVGANMHF